MTSLDLWEAFVHAHRERSISGAARRLDLSQPAVTARVRRLEEELGATLFERSRAGLVPTSQADALAGRITPLLDRLRRAVSVEPTMGPASIRIGGAADVMSARMVPALGPLIRDGLDLAVTTGLAPDLLDALAADRLDLVVSSIRPSDDGLRSTALVDEEFVLVAAPALAVHVDAAALDKDPVRALASIPLLAFSPELPIIRRYWLTEFEERPTNRIALVLPDLRGILRAVIAGIGASVLPRYLADGALADGTVVRLHEPRFGPLNTLWLVTRPDAPPVVEHVARHLAAETAGWAST